MQQANIKQILQEIDLNIDMETIQEAINFLEKQIGIISDIDLKYQVYGAAAIVCEMKTIPTIGKEAVSKNGIRIENVMSHLGGLSKQEFLEAIKRQLEKYRASSTQNIIPLKKKVQDVKYSYRIYKKYQMTFNQIYQNNTSLNKVKRSEYSALFWVLYLYIKNSYVEVENIGQAKTLLILLFRAVFERYLIDLDFDEIITVMSQSIGLIEQISEEKKKFYFEEFNKKLDYFYSRRFSEKSINFKKINENYSCLTRLLDDMSNLFEEEKSRLRHFNQIDEISYLELKKNLTPQVIRGSFFVDSIEPINKPLFMDSDDSDEDDSSDDQDEQNSVKNENENNENDYKIQSQRQPKIIDKNDTENINNNNDIYVIPKLDESQKLKPKEVSPENTLMTTPISKKIQNQKWVQKCLSLINQEEKLKFKDIYEENFQKPYAKFLNEIKQKNYSLIREFKPKSQNYNQKESQIFNFFIFNFIEIYQSTENHRNWLRQPQIVNSLICFSSALFYYSQNSIKSQFRRYCEIYGVNIINSFKALQLFQAHLLEKLPIDLQNFVKNTQKRLMITQIWQDEEGYKILTEQSTSLPIKQKINSYAKLRIGQICKSASISAHLNEKVYNILVFIFKQKTFLLKTSNLDQIILCCIMSCLSINQKQEKKTLYKLFGEYNSRIEYAFNSYQFGLKDNQGKQVDIVEYYNQVFLSEIQEMINMNNDQGLDSILITPVRINISKAEIKNRIGLNLGNIKQEGPEMRRKAYIQNMIKRQSEMKQMDQDEEEDMKSPLFGGLKRHFSFGKQQ